MTYIGVRGRNGCIVRIHDDATDTDLGPLPPRLDLRNHSPDGFEWGYLGSGPAQLALAILANHLASDFDALALYQDFKSAVVARLAGDEWFLTDAAIAREVAAITAARE